MTISLPPDQEYFSIGEVSQLTDLKPYILRYWESKFGLLHPARRESGQRKFTRRDVETIAYIRELLYDRRFTIEGAKKHLRDKAKRGPVQMSFELEDTVAAMEVLRDVKKELTGLLRDIKSQNYAPAKLA